MAGILPGRPLRFPFDHERVPEFGGEARPLVEASGLGDRPSCLGNLAEVENSGALVEVRAGDAAAVVGRVFDDRELARLLCRRPELIARWRQARMFPEPSLVGPDGQGYYADAEVCDFVRILGEHQRLHRCYRPRDTAVRRRLFQCAFANNKAAKAAWLAINRAT